MEENKSLQDMINKYSKDLMEYYRNIKKNNTAVETATVSISSVNEKGTEETIVEEKNTLPEENNIEKEPDININNSNPQQENIGTNDVTAKELYDEFKKENIRVYVIKQEPNLYIIFAGYKNNQDLDIKNINTLTKGFKQNK